MNFLNLKIFVGLFPLSLLKAVVDNFIQLTDKLNEPFEGTGQW